MANKDYDDEPPGQVRKSGSDERKAKRAKREKETEEVYCICRRPHEGKFMIECDTCNEWYHGTCVNISPEEAKHIDKYNCNGCCLKNLELDRIVYKTRYLKELKKQQQLATVHCGNCINCFQTEDCGCCMTCEIGEPCLKRRCVQAEVLLKAQEGHHAPRVKKERTDESLSSPPPQASTAGEIKKGRGRKKGSKSGTHQIGKKYMDKRIKQEEHDESPSKMTALEAKSYYEQDLDKSIYNSHMRASRGQRRKSPIKKLDPMQCYGPKCVQAARVGSKYCSDECGMNLAKARLHKDFYSKLNDYFTELPRSLIRRNAEDRRLQTEFADHAVKEKTLLEYQRIMENYVTKIKDLEPFTGMDDGDGDSEYTVHCAVCALEYPARQIAKHTIHCFMKMEKQTSFGTALKMPVNPSNLFCEAFNKVNNTYCKRLRVICAEHYKSELENQLKVCGYPKAWTQCDSASPEALFERGELGMLKEGYCDTERKKCLQHHRWVQAMLATLETDRLYVLTKMDEIFEKRRAVESFGKPDVLSLMLNDREVVASQTQERCNGHANDIFEAMTTLSKAEYLKRYMSGGGDTETSKEKKKKKKTKPDAGAAKGMKIVEDDAFASVEAAKMRDVDSDEEREELEVIRQVERKMDKAPMFKKAFVEVVEIKEEPPDEDAAGNGKTKGFAKSTDRMGRRRHDSDESPPRHSKENREAPRRRRHDSDNSPARRASPDDNSPPRQRRRHDSDNSPVRRKSPSPDNSPPRRRRRHDSDNSPSRRKSPSPDQSPPRRRHRHDSDSSPPRKSTRTRHDSLDQSPPRRKGRKDSDSSPPRRSRKSPSPKRRIKQESPDLSPPRKSSRKSPSPKRRIKEEPVDSDASPPRERQTKTLDGKKAGLQSAKNLREETDRLKRNEEEMFAEIDNKYSGRDAETIYRKRQLMQKGKKVETEEQKAKKAREEVKQKELQEKYQTWNKGIKQIQERQDKLEEMARVAAEPMARMADDESMNAHLKGVLHEADPMAALIQNKRREDAIDRGELVYPTYNRPFPPNRFGIRPGYRWDGVDRSSGFEGKLAMTSNARRAQETEYYKSVAELD
ncbi:hypothetical protein WR25_00940 [Diploscapter pachys]|uniref:BUD13 homolog n=1 Tax=Diploscapter pachys TaxID=2018661 RepID=A0A2A2KN29_9BILA|nr:hypothetical protein WR25_00940 [Diploscapter pachys]